MFRVDPGVPARKQWPLRVRGDGSLVGGKPLPAR